MPNRLSWSFTQTHTHTQQYEVRSKCSLRVYEGVAVKLSRLFAFCDFLPHRKSFSYAGTMQAFIEILYCSHRSTRRLSMFVD